jgi:hypothetical protein
MAFRVEPGQQPTRRVHTLEGQGTSWEEPDDPLSQLAAALDGRVAFERVSEEGRKLVRG